EERAGGPRGTPPTRLGPRPRGRVPGGRRGGAAAPPPASMMTARFSPRHSRAGCFYKLLWVAGARAETLVARPCSSGPPARGEEFSHPGDPQSTTYAAPYASA